MPEATLRAFAEHGRVPRTSPIDVVAAERTLEAARDDGIDLDAITAGLERDGVRAFCDSYRELLDCIASKLRAPSVAVVAAARG